MNLLITLPVGMLLVALSFFMLLRFAKLQPLTAGLVTTVLTVAVYTAVSIWRWQGGDVFAVHIALYLITVYVLTIISNARKTAGPSSRRWHWAPALIIGFFVVVVSVDSVFILLAQRGVDKEWARRILPTPRGGGEVESRFPGVVSHDFREREEQFNAYQAQRDLQQARGWQFQIGWEKTATINQNNTLMLSLQDAQQQAIADAIISGRFMYPGDARLDQTFSMQSLGDGLYQADIRFSKAGPWDLVLSVARNSELHELRTSTTILINHAKHE